MSHEAQRRVQEQTLSQQTLSRISRRSIPAAELVPALLLAVVALLLAMRWWAGVEQLSLPLSRGVLDLPLFDLLHQMPGYVLVGLLFVRATALARDRTLATQHLSEMAARWAWLWVGTSLVWLALTASRLTGVSIPALGSREDLFAVLGRSDQANAQIATLWVALVIALFATRLTSTLETRALVVLAAAAMLPVLSNLPGAGHDPATTHTGGDLHWLATVALAVQLLAAVVWLGFPVAMVIHLRRLPLQLHRAVAQFSRSGSLCVLLIGLAALVQESLTLRGPTLWQTTSGQLLFAKAVGLLLLVTVGYRHRSRTAHAGGSGGPLTLLQLAGGELVLLGAVVAITMVPTPIA